MNISLLHTEALNKKYTMGELEVHALNGISLTVDHGEFIAITGASGSGKSTLMHLLGCLDTPTSGSYTLDGIDVSTASTDKRAQIRNQKIGFVFQKFHLLADMTAQGNVSLPLLYAGLSKQEAFDKARDMLCSVGLDKRITHYPYQLSGGQQQRVAIARALINKPSIVLADEPTGNLDSATGDSIMEIFTELNRQKITIMIVTHEPHIAKKTKRILDMLDGKINSDKKVT